MMTLLSDELPLELTSSLPLSHLELLLATQDFMSATLGRAAFRQALVDCWKQSFLDAKKQNGRER